MVQEMRQQQAGLVDVHDSADEAMYSICVLRESHSFVHEAPIHQGDQSHGTYKGFTISNIIQTRRLASSMLAIVELSPSVLQSGTLQTS